jgi:hypothetical protein
MLPTPAPLAVPAPPRPPPDLCGAATMQSLVGKRETEIPVPLEPSRRRVACSTCPLSHETLPGRLTIIFDSVTGLVTSVRCG